MSDRLIDRYIRCISCGEATLVELELLFDIIVAVNRLSELHAK